MQFLVLEEVAFQQSVEEVTAGDSALATLELFSLGLSILIDDIFQEFLEVVLMVDVNLEQVLDHDLLFTSDFELVLLGHSLSVVRVAFDIDDSVYDVLCGVEQTFSGFLVLLLLLHEVFSVAGAQSHLLGLRISLSFRFL